jgi:hypothetical protein
MTIGFSPEMAIARLALPASSRPPAPPLTGTVRLLI